MLKIYTLFVRLFILVVTLLSTVFFSEALVAHDNSGAAIYVDVSSQAIRLEMEIPLSNLRHELNRPAQGLFLEFPNPKVDEYARQHLSLYSKDRQPLTLELRSTEVVNREGKDYQKIEVLAQLPEGTSSREFVLDSDIIIHNRTDKHIMVFLRNDFESGKLESVHLVNELSPNSHVLHFKLEEGHWFKGFKTSFLLGMNHIAEGTDHLLFLFTLLLTAGLLVHEGKVRTWAGIASPERTFKAIFVIVSAFTLGHSLTLFIGAIGLNILPSKWVETLIAASILLTALHAIIPIFPKKEGWIALGFGLIHGLGFASAIQDLGVQGQALFVTILGFSFGIEFMQGILIILTLPMIYSIYCGRFGTGMRRAGGVFAIVMAFAWLFERLSDTELYAMKRFDELTYHGLWLLIGLVALAILSRIVSDRRLESTFEATK